MTDKEKFRKEIEKLKSQLLRGACSSQIAMETMCKEEAYNEVLAILDAMQEEPVSIWHDASKKSDNPEDVVIINPSDNTGEVLTKCTGVNQGHIWAYTSELLKLDNSCNIGKNLQEPQVKELAEIQHVNETCKENGNSLTQEPVSVWHDMSEEAENGRNTIIIDPKDFYGAVLRKGGSQLRNHNKERYVKWAYIDDIINITNKEEPVSEDLGDYINELSKQFPEVSFAKLSRIAVRVAKWQKEKEYTCYEEAFEDGAKWKVESLWKPADGDDLPDIDREVIVLVKYSTQRNIHDEEYPTYRVGFGHRPNPDGWDGKNIDTNEVTHYTPKLYDKGGWNAPDIVYWLDVKLPKEIEL